MVLGQVGAGILGIAEAATLIGGSERQVRRLLASYQRDGSRGIVHGNRGRTPAHATNPEVWAQVIALSSGKYEGVNHCYLAELLGEREGLGPVGAKYGEIAGFDLGGYRRCPRGFGACFCCYDDLVTS